VSPERTRAALVRTLRAASGGSLRLGYRVSWPRAAIVLERPLEAFARVHEALGRHCAARRSNSPPPFARGALRAEHELGGGRRA
jgi:hypothetical protein